MSVAPLVPDVEPRRHHAAKKEVEKPRPVADKLPPQAPEVVAKTKGDVAARAKLTAGLQQQIGNARVGALAEKKGEAEKPEKPAPQTAKKAIAPAINAVKQRATKARRHGAPAGLVGSAQAAAIDPKTEQTRGAAVATVGQLDQAKAEKIRRDQFKANLRKAIDEATPKPATEEQARSVIKTGAKTASAVLGGSLAEQRDAAAGGVKSAAAAEVDPSTQPAPKKTELVTEAAGAPPAPVSAAPLVPAPMPAEQLDYSSNRESTDTAMADAGVTTEQLGKGNEPQFNKTLSERSNAEQHDATAAAKYRKSEAGIQQQAEKVAAGALANGLDAIHGARELQLGNVTAQQTTTKTKDALERERVTTTINGIKERTRKDVGEILDAMECDASPIFEAGLKRAEQAYDDAFFEARGGLFTRWTTWGDDWEEHINNALATGRAAYMAEVEIAIDQVADLVDTKLGEAKQRVADGRKEVDEFVAGLEGSVREFGDEALKDVSADFDAMESEIDDRRDALVTKLQQQYKASQERMAEREQELRDLSKGFWERVYDATVGVIKKILAFKDMLLGILGKAASVVLDILSDPIGFLGNLVSAVMGGLENFMGRIGEHLQKGLMEWLFGALAGAGLQLPETFDLKGILSIVLQILGLTYTNFRARAVGIVGEPIVSAIETTADIFKAVVTEGPAALWRFVEEKVQDLKTMVMDAIFDYIKERVLIAGITWIISLLNPASAFFKACKAIYDIIVFFINRGSQILALVNAVIDSIAEIAKGSLDSAAQKVEDALAKAIPVAIGFLSALLNLGDISGTVRKTIDRAQAPVNRAIDWAIGLAVKGVRAVGKVLGGGEKKEEKKTTEATPDPVHDAKIEAGLLAIDAQEKEVAPEGRPTLEQAEAIAARVKTDHPVFRSITVIDGKNRWVYHWTGSEGDKPGQPIDPQILALIARLDKIAAGKGAEKLIKILQGRLPPNMRKGYVFQAERTLYWDGEGLLLYIEYKQVNPSTEEVSVFDIVINDPDGARVENGERMRFYVDTKNWEKTNELIHLLEQLEAAQKEKQYDPKKWEGLEKAVNLRIANLDKRISKYRRLGLPVVIEWRGEIPKRIEALNAERTDTLGSVKIISIPVEL